jgi:hypothetical protein
MGRRIQYLLNVVPLTNVSCCVLPGCCAALGPAHSTYVLLGIERPRRMVRVQTAKTERAEIKAEKETLPDHREEQISTDVTHTYRYNTVVQHTVC